VDFHILFVMPRMKGFVSRRACRVLFVVPRIENLEIIWEWLSH